MRSLFVLRIGMTERTLIGEHDLAVVEAAIKEAAATLGEELVEIKIYKEYGEFAFEALLWKKEGVSLDDCERAHGVISDLLDRYDDMFLSPYNLKISSMGLDRPIVTDDDYRRSLGVEIECRVGKQKHVGVLQAFDCDKVILLSDGKTCELKRNILTKVQPYIRF